MQLKPIKLTPTDKIILDSYKRSLEGLGEFLGAGVEIVLHSLESFDKSAVMIVNGYHSGRGLGSPITDLALNILLKYREDEETRKEAFTYFNRNKTGEMLKSVTILIRGENARIIGLLCMNYYLSISLQDFLSEFLPNDKTRQTNREMETFAQSSNELVQNTTNKIREEVLKNQNISTSQKNKEIIRGLYRSGIFNLKDSVDDVTNLLGISKSTTYLHLRNIKSEA